MMRLPGGSLIKFFVLTYAVTWTCFVSVAAAGIPARSPLGVFLVLLGAYAPSLAALWLTARAAGGAGIRALLGRILRWRVPAQWYLFAVPYIPALKLTAALVHRVATGAWPSFGHEPWYLIPAAIAFSTGAREHPAGADLRLLAPASVLHSGRRHVWTVVLRRCPLLGLPAEHRSLARFDGLLGGLQIHAVQQAIAPDCFDLVPLANQGVDLLLGRRLISREQIVGGPRSPEQPGEDHDRNTNEYPVRRVHSRRLTDRVN